MGIQRRNWANVAICTACWCASSPRAIASGVFQERPGAGPIIHRSRIRHPDFLPEGVTAIGQKGGYVSAVESVVDLGTSSNQDKKSNDIWSEWQDLNLRPLRPERWLLSRTPLIFNHLPSRSPVIISVCSRYFGGYPVIDVSGRPTTTSLRLCALEPKLRPPPDLPGEPETAGADQQAIHNPHRRRKQRKP